MSQILYISVFFVQMMILYITVAIDIRYCNLTELYDLSNTEILVYSCLLTSHLFHYGKFIYIWVNAMTIVPNTMSSKYYLCN